MFVWPAFFPDSRGNRLEKFVVKKDPNSELRRLYLCGPDEVAVQARWMLQGAGAQDVALTEEQAKDWSHRIQFSGELPGDVRRTLELLQEVLTLTLPQPPVDIAVALDFYKKPPEAGSDRFTDTPAGRVVRLAKYETDPHATQHLVKALCEVVRIHRMYSAADYVVAVPGHTGNASFSVKLATLVAGALDLPMLTPSTTRESRPAAKQRETLEQPLDLANEFKFGSGVEGRVLLVVDDVCRTGQTMTAVAQAAKDAGAAAVFGLIGARTLRNR